MPGFGMISGRTTGIGAVAASGLAAWTEIWSATLTADSVGNEGYSYRQYALGFPTGSWTQLRLTLEGPGSVAAVTLDHVSVGVWTGTNYNTTATPAEVKFSGSSGVTLGTQPKSLAMLLR